MSYKIMCDLDDVVFDFVPHFLALTNELFEHNDQPEDISDWNWWECPFIDLTFEEFIYGMKLFTAGEYWKDIPLHKGVVPHILDLIDKGADIYYVSDRPEKAFEWTQNALRKAHIPIVDNRLIFRSSKEKANLCRTLSINIVIEDNVDTVLSCVASGIQSVLQLRSHNMTKWDSVECKDNITPVHCFGEFANIARKQICLRETQEGSA